MILTPKYWVFSVTGAVMPQLTQPAYHAISTRQTYEQSASCAPEGLTLPLSFADLRKGRQAFLPVADNSVNVITRSVITMQWA